MSKKVLAIQALRDAKDAVDFKRRSLSSAFRKALNHKLSKKQFEATEKELTEALIPFFVEQGRSMAKKLENTSPSSDAAKLVKRIFDPKEWKADLTNIMLPILARRMGEAAVAHLLTLGIDVRKKNNK